MKVKLLLVMVLLLSVGVSAIDFEVLEEDYDIGDNITLKVSAEGLTDITKYGVCLNYDDNILKFVRSTNNEEENILYPNDYMQLPYNEENITCFSSVIGYGQMPENYTNEGNGVLAEYTFEILSEEETSVIFVDEGQLSAQWESLNGTNNYFEILDVEINGCNNAEDRCEIIEKTEDNRTRITFETSKTIEVISTNITVKEAEDKIATTNKLEFILEGNGTEEVKMNISFYGKPEKVLVDNVETQFSFINDTITFTATFSERTIVFDYNVPAPPPPPPSTEVSSGGSSSSNYRKTKDSGKVATIDPCDKKLYWINELECKETCSNVDRSMFYGAGYKLASYDCSEAFLDKKLLQKNVEEPIVVDTKEDTRDIEVTTPITEEEGESLVGLWITLLIIVIVIGFGIYSYKVKPKGVGEVEE